MTIKLPKILSNKIINKYKIVNNSFIDKDKKEKHNEFETELGDIKQENFIPQIKIKRWDNECNFSARLITDDNSQPIIQIDEDKIKFIKKDTEIHFYQLDKKIHTQKDKKGIEQETMTHEYGGYEFEVILKKKPKTNQIKMSIQTKGLDFFYQPELTQEEKEKGSYRSDEVVGSYAVYHKEKMGDYSKAGGKNYMSGKAFHIYRPKIFDNNGSWIWGELNIDIQKGILTVTIPQDFVDNAVYPIRHAAGATFGYTTAGGTQSPIIYNNILVGPVFTFPTVNGIVDTITVYGRGTNNLKGVIVKHSDLNIVANGVSNSTAIVGAPAWYSASFGTNPSLAASTPYILMVIVDVEFYYKFDAGATDQGHISSGNSYSSPTNPTIATHNTNKYSIYCTYTALSAPTVTTQACSNIAPTTATGNGNITATGGANATRRGFCYMAGTSGDPTTANSVVYDDGDFGIGSYTKGITGLTQNTGYRVRAYAINSAGTAYGATVQLTTANAFTKSLAETINLDDDISNGAVKILSDTSSLADAIQNAPTKNLSDNPSLSDTIKNDPVKILSDNAGIADSINTDSVYLRNLSDTVALADALIKTANINIAEILNITDGGLVISVNKNLADSLSLDDLISPLLTINEIIQDSINLADDIKKDNTKNLTEIINLSDALSSVSAYLRNIGDTISIDDLLIKTINKSLVDSTTLADQLGIANAKVLLDSLSISDEKTIGIYKNLSDNPAISDDIKKTIDKNLSESLTLSDDIQTLKAIYYEIINIVSISDILYNSINKNIADALSIIDALQKQTGKSLEDNFLVIESISKNTGKKIEDSANLSDDIKFDTKISIQDSISIAETLVKGYDKTLIEALSIADSIQKSIQRRLYKKTIVLNNKRDKILLISNNRRDKIILKSNPQ